MNLSRRIHIYKISQVGGNYSVNNQTEIAPYTSRNYQEGAFPTISTKWVEVLPAENQIKKIMSSWISLAGNSHVNMSFCFLTVLLSKRIQTKKLINLADKDMILSKGIQN